MQTFNTYILEIFKTVDIDIPTKGKNETVTLKEWVDSQDIDTLISYANDYAKDCIRLDHERIINGINKKQLENNEEGTFKYDWCYEECVEVVNQK